MPPPQTSPEGKVRFRVKAKIKIKVKVQVDILRSGMRQNPHLQLPQKALRLLGLSCPEALLQKLQKRL